MHGSATQSRGKLVDKHGNTIKEFPEGTTADFMNFSDVLKAAGIDSLEQSHATLAGTPRSCKIKSGWVGKNSLILSAHPRAVRVHPVRCVCIVRADEHEQIRH